MADTLVLYFTRSGTTKKLATQLAERLGADLEFIKPDISYSGTMGYLAGIWHSLTRRAPSVHREHDPAKYSAVILGTPVWAGRLSAPARSYLTRFGAQLGPLAAFWVSGSGAAYPALATEIERLIGRTLVATASFGAREVGTTVADQKLDRLSRDLQHTQKAA